MDPFEIHDAKFRHYVLDNAPLERLAEGFRWIEGLVWMGDAACLLFQDLPRDRTMRWIEDAGVWSSAADGVHCIDPYGRLLGKIRLPQRVSNLTFGGALRNRLFIGASHTLYAIFLNRRGVRWP